MPMIEEPPPPTAASPRRPNARGATRGARRRIDYTRRTRARARRASERASALLLPLDANAVSLRKTSMRRSNPAHALDSLVTEKKLCADYLREAVGESAEFVPVFTAPDNSRENGPRESRRMSFNK